MIDGGYYIKARKIQESLISVQQPCVREIWDWLLKEANHSETKYAGFIIKRGQLFRTYKDIREGLHWMIGWRKMMYNENQTKKAMKFLRKTQMIDTKKKPGGVLITICNYDYYQDPQNYERTNERTIERTIDEPLTNHPIPYNNKNVKNVKNKDNPKKNNSSPQQKIGNEKKDIDARAKKFGAGLTPFLDEYKKDLVVGFYNYWTEPNKSRTKLRFEMERTWDTKTRLDTWRRNDENWKK